MMEILFKPVFEYTDSKGNKIRTGINTMENDDELNIDVHAYFAALFPGENREISRLRGSSYYMIESLPGEEIPNIKEWYIYYLDEAENLGFDEKMYIEEVEPYGSDEGRIEDAILYMDLMTHPMYTNFDFSTPETREDIMLRYINEHDTLDTITLNHLFANELNFTGLSFEKTILPNASFVGALLPLTNFNKADLKNANFSGADLRYANLTDADFTGANFTGANLTGADLTKADFLNADLTGAIFTESIWQEAKNLLDNPTFRAPITPVSAAVDLPIPFTLKKQIKSEREDRTKIVKPTVLEKPNRYNIGTPENPIWREDEIDEMDITRFKTTRRGPRKRMVAERAVYSMKPAEYERVDPSIVTLDNEESDVGKMLNEDALFDDEPVSLKEFFKGPGGFLFRVVQGDKFEDILVSANGYQPNTSKYLRSSTDLKLYTCNEPGSMNRKKINLNRPLIDIGKAIGLQATRIYVDYHSFVKTVLDDTRQYKCYILYKYKTSEKYKSLASYNAIYNPTGDPEVYVSNLHCNEGADMDGVIWSIKPIGDNLLNRRSSKKIKTINKPKRKTPERTTRNTLHRTRRRSLTAADETTAGGGKQKRRGKKKTRKIQKK